MRVSINTYFVKATLLAIGCWIAATLLPQQAQAQHQNPFGASFFQNQYLSNPALSGLDAGWKLNAGYRQEWTSITDAPNNQYLTAEYRLQERMGLGLKVVNDMAGAFRSTTAMGTYSYHLPLFGAENDLHFGISAGIINRGLNNSKLNGETDDPLVMNYNDKSTRFEADFGVAYMDKRITVQAAFPNLVGFFNKDNKDQVDRSTFFASAGYKFIFNEGTDEITIEPRAVFRGIKGYDNIIDGGANFTIKNNLVNLFGMYHSSENITIGGGIAIAQQWRIVASYTSGTSALRGFSNGSFEIGISAGFAGKK